MSSTEKIIITSSRISPPPPPPTTTTGTTTSFPILAFSILGILAAAVLLVGYYTFVTKCFSNWRHANRSLRRRRFPSAAAGGHPLMAYAAAAVHSRRGLDESLIQSIPTFRFRRICRRPAGDDDEGGSVIKDDDESFHECSVCLNEFQEDEKLRMLPTCFHVFHVDCIDTWLQTHNNCPICRSGIAAVAVIAIVSGDGGFPILPNFQSGDGGAAVAIDVEDDPPEEASPPPATRKLSVMSMGDECIEGRSSSSVEQPIRRSFSMDSSASRLIHLSVRESLRVAGAGGGSGEGSSGSGVSGGGGNKLMRKHFFSFGGHGRRSSVLPVELDLEP